MLDHNRLVYAPIILGLLAIWMTIAIRNGDITPNITAVEYNIFNGWRGKRGIANPSKVASMITK